MVGQSSSLTVLRLISHSFSQPVGLLVSWIFTKLAIDQHFKTIFYANGAPIVSVSRSVGIRI